MSIINEKTIIEIEAMIMLLLHAARIVAVTTSSADKGAEIVSKIVP